MSAFAKDLGELSSPERLHSTRLDSDAERVLWAVESRRGWVSSRALSAQIMLPVEKVLGSLVELTSAGLIAVRPSGKGQDIEATLASLAQ